MSQKKFLKAVDKVVNGLDQERAETQEMVKTFFKVLTKHLPKGKAPEDEEVQAAIEQLKDVHKMAGLLLVSITPGSLVTLPALCALGRRYGIELLPSAFKKDEVELEILEDVLETELKDK